MNSAALVVYLCLLSTSFFASKFVLTSIGFRYPMIFQGWQTLVGFLLLRLLHAFDIITLTPIDRSGFISLFPSFLFFTASILTGSMALSHIPILTFVAASGCVPVAVTLFQDAGKKNSQNKKVRFAACGVVIGSSVLLLGLEQLYGGKEGYFWLEVHVLSSVGLIVYTRITDARFNSVDRQYYCYLFSLIVLLPASLYVHEAFEALNFKELYQLMFIAGSLACAVSGMALSFYQSRLKDDKKFGLLHHAGLAFVAAFSLAYFELDFHTFWTIPCALVSLVALLFVPTHLLPEEDEEEGGGLQLQQQTQNV